MALKEIDAQCVLVVEEEEVGECLMSQRLLIFFIVVVNQHEDRVSKNKERSYKINFIFS